MNAHWNGIVMLLVFVLTGCSPALHRRESQPAPLTRTVCTVRGPTKACTHLTELQFNEVWRQLQPPI